MHFDDRSNIGTQPLGLFPCDGIRLQLSERLPFLGDSLTRLGMFPLDHLQSVPALFLPTFSIEPIVGARSNGA